MNENFAKFILDFSYFLRGEDVWAILDRIDGYQWLTSNSLEEMQFHQIKKLLSSAFLHVPYYQRIMKERGIHPDGIQSFEDFSQFPVLTKENIKANWRYLMNGNAKLRTSLRQTSGSTGVPLRIIKDRQTTAFMDAAMYRSYSWYGISPGARQLRIWGTEIGALGKAKERLKDLLLNRIRLSAFDLDKGNFSDLIWRIDRFRPFFIYGYAQSVFEFAKFIVGENLDLSYLKLRAVIVTGEMIFDWQKQLINCAFKCPVINEYGCTEAGIISIECPSGNMHVMSDILYVETLKSNGLNDEEEGEILITELNNNYSPLIRYKVGDKGKLFNKLCPCGRGFPVLTHLKGRSDDFIVFPNGK
jgi:phenylacetate-CoA ligase